MAKPRTPSGEPAHDVLAAEEFGVPAPDPDLHRHGPVTLPDDPTGIAEPHDVLAAEEFAMPAPRYGAQSFSDAARTRSARARVVVLGLAALVLLRRLGRRKRGT